MNLLYYERSPSAFTTMWKLGGVLNVPAYAGQAVLFRTPPNFPSEFPIIMG